RHDRGHLRAVSAPARLHPADTARTRGHRARAGTPRRGPGSPRRQPVLMPDLWIPGFAGPLDDLVNRIHRRIEQFASESGVEQPAVEIELAGGTRYTVESLSAEPGYGFVTLRPHAADDAPQE